MTVKIKQIGVTGTCLDVKFVNDWSPGYSIFLCVELKVNGIYKFRAAKDPDLPRVNPAEALEFTFTKEELDVRATELIGRGLQVGDRLQVLINGVYEWIDQYLHRHATVIFQWDTSNEIVWSEKVEVAPSVARYVAIIGGIGAGAGIVGYLATKKTSIGVAAALVGALLGYAEIYREKTPEAVAWMSKRNRNVRQ